MSLLSVSSLSAAPPSTLALTSPPQAKKKVLVAPTLSLSLGNETMGILFKTPQFSFRGVSALWCWVAGRSGSMVSDDLPSVFLSPSPEDEDDQALDFDLDALETPSDSESLPFPMYDLDLEGEGS